jgi:hypothetical protein
MIGTTVAALLTVIVVSGLGVSMGAAFLIGMIMGAIGGAIGVIVAMETS